ncbi:MAG: xylulokinase [Halanaerobiales bacterium]
MEYYMGIDLGTSSVKVVLLDQNFKVVDSISKKYDILYPESGWAEQNPEDWLEQIYSCLQEMIATHTLYNKQFYIGVTGQMHGVVPLNKEGEVIYPCIIWADRRTENEIKIMKNKLNSKHLSRLSNPVVNGFSAPKIMWLRQHRDQLKDNLNQVLMPKDYVIYSLTGKYVTDESEASGTLLFDVKNRRWDKEIMDILDIPADILPEIKKPGTEIGYLSRSCKNKLNLNRDIPVIAAGGDAPLAAMANNITEPGKVGINLGTAGQILTSLNEYKVDPEFRLHTLCHGISGKWYIMGAIKAAGFCLQWWNDVINKGQKSTIGELIKNAYTESEPGARGIIFLPYLNNGERSPHMDSLAPGNLFGLQGEHHRPDITRAILEGVAFAFRQNLEIIKNLNIPVDKIVITGGGTKTPYWARIIASVLQQKVYLSNETRSSAFGAALSAASAVTGKEYPEIISSIESIELQSYKPERSSKSIYDKSFDLYKESYYNNRKLFKELSKIR